MHSRVSGISLGMIAAALAIDLASAGDMSPVIVVPGRPGVPVMMNGRDVSGAVIEGDWGLARPGSVEPTVIYPRGPRVIYGSGAGGGYYPATGGAPAYGRREIIPPANRPLPRPAESFYRSWGAESDPVPASPPSANPTAVIVAPVNDEGRRRKRRSGAPAQQHER
jgi:hypothetical protein